MYDSFGDASIVTSASTGRALCHHEPDRQLPRLSAVPLATSHEGRALVNNGIGVAWRSASKEVGRVPIGCGCSCWWCGPVAEVFVDFGGDCPESALAVFAHDDVHLAGAVGVGVVVVLAVEHEYAVGVGFDLS